MRILRESSHETNITLLATAALHDEEPAVNGVMELKQARKMGLLPLTAYVPAFWACCRSTSRTQWSLISRVFHHLGNDCSGATVYWATACG